MTKEGDRNDDASAPAGSETASDAERLPSGPRDVDERRKVARRRPDDSGADGLGEFRQVPLEGLDPADLAGVSSLEVTETIQHWQGPLPDPATLRFFEEIHPGAGRILFEDLERRSISNAKAVDAAAAFDHAKANALRDLTRAQAFAVRGGTWIGAGGLVVIAVGAVMPIFGASVPESLLGTIPGLIIAAGGFMSDVLGRARDKGKS